MDIHNNSVEYQKGYTDGYQWSQYDYTYNHGPEYDAGFMAGYFEKNGRTFTGKTSSEIEAERQAQEEQYRQFNIRNNNFPRLVKTPYSSSGTILGKIIDLLKSLLKLVFTLFTDSDMNNSQKVFGFVNAGTVKIIQAMKGLVILLMIWAVISASSVFKGNNNSNKANYKDDKKPQIEKTAYNYDTPKDKTYTALPEANFEDNKPVIISQNSIDTPQNSQENNDEVFQGVERTEWNLYMNDLFRRIKANWVLPKDTEKNNLDNVKVVVKFNISKEGNLIGEPVIKESSGIESVDLSCIEAIKLTSPFRVLPKGFSGEYLDTDFTFETINHSN